MSDIDLVKKVRGYAEEAEKNGFEVLTVPLRDLFPLLGRMEAAERERDEYAEGERLKAVKNVELQDEIYGLKAEIARRDAAAGEASDRVVDDGDGQQIGGVGVSDRLNCLWPIGTKFYTAAPPAVLRDIEPLIEGALKLHGLLTAVDGHSQLSDGFRNGARWAAKELGAQQQKVVELYKRKSMEVISGQRYSYVLLDDLLPELDAANVKWEVKK